MIIEFHQSPNILILYQKALVNGATRKSDLLQKDAKVKVVGMRSVSMNINLYIGLLQHVKLFGNEIRVNVLVAELRVPAKAQLNGTWTI
jgi:hypothetical protein